MDKNTKKADYPPGISQDIIDCKRVEAEELLLDNIELQLWYLTDIETYGAVNAAHAKFFSVQKEDLENKTLWEIVSSEKEANICIEGNKQVFQEKKQIKKEEWVVNGLGNPRLLAITKTPKLDSEGSVEYVVCSALDITDQRRTEKEIENTKLFLDNIINTASDPIFVKDSQHRFVVINEACCNFLGYSREEMLGKTDYDFFPEKEADVFRNNDELVFSTGFDNISEEIITDLFGNQHIISTKKSVFSIPNTSEKFLVGIIHDITDLKQAEEALRISEERFRLAASSTSDLVYQWNLSDNSLQWFGDIDKLMGYEEGQFPSTIKGWITHIHPEDKERVLSIAREFLKKRKPWAGDYRVIHQNGSIIRLHGTAIPAFEEKGKPAAVIGAITDITARKKTEETLQESERHYRQIVELLPIAIFGHCDKKILFTNGAAVNLVNAKNMQAIIGKSFTELLLPEYKEEFFKKINELKNNQDYSKKLMAKILSMTGNVVDIELVLSPFIFQNKQVIQIVAYDMTRRKKIDEEILKADKLESMSLLAGGIAHDFNNLLAAILGNISLSLKDIKQEGKVFKRLKNAEKLIQQANLLTRQLQTFAKGEDPVKTTHSIKELIQEIIPFILSGSNVQCNYIFADELSYVDIDTGQINQVINNLVINALHAMPEGGRINVSAENVIFGKGKNDCNCPIEEGPYVKVMIQDSGMGIEKRNLKKIFDPFFTTKTEGSGLGLATSYSIIKKHGGCIKVESEPGEGTAFYIYLPASTAKPPSKNKKKDKVQIVRGSGKILVMDDEESIRDVLGEMLAFLGYEVDFAEEGTEAIGKYIKSMELNLPYDMVILDLTIPGGMGGKQVVSILKSIDPQVKAIVSTGYSEDMAASNCMNYGFKGFILKPYDIEQLNQLLKSI